MYLLYLLYGLFALIPKQKEHCLVNEPMDVCYLIVNDSLQIEVITRTGGWGAIGFNEYSGSKGTYLIMFCVENEELCIEEHYVSKLGHHSPIKGLIDQPSIKVIEYYKNGCVMRGKFRLPLRCKNRYLDNLKNDNRYYLTLATSLENDFYHHSNWFVQQSIFL